MWSCGLTVYSIFHRYADSFWTEYNVYANQCTLHRIVMIISFMLILSPDVEGGNLDTDDPDNDISRDLEII